MFNTIIVGVDGRDQDDEALALARQLAAPGAEIIATNVVLPDRGATVVARTDHLERSDSLLDAITVDLPETEAVSTPAETIADGLSDLARDRSADLVVLASSRRGAIGRIVAGDTIRDVLRSSPSPVAVAPIGPRAVRPLNHIVVGYDGTAEADSALEGAVALAGRADATVSVVVVVEPLVRGSTMSGTYAGNAFDDRYARARASLDRIEKEHGLKGVIATGDPAKQLVGASRDADLLAIGFHDHGRLDRLLYGDTSLTLLHTDATALLVTPPAPVGALRDRLSGP